jgi:molybdate transport system substrate-binding protein
MVSHWLVGKEPQERSVVAFAQFCFANHRRLAAVGLLAALAVALPRPAIAGVAAVTVADGAKKPTSKPSRSTPTRSTTTTRRPASAKAPLTSAVTLSTSAPTSTPATTAVPVKGSVTVFAASSLTAAFTDIAAAFEKANPAAAVKLNFAGSSTLATQILNGAPADVFASADNANMARIDAAGQLGAKPAVFADNRLMIVVWRGNPLGVKTLDDLSRPEVFVGLGAVGVPVGDYARQVLARAGVNVKPKTLESNVSAIVTKVALRELDAGIVYVTDVALDEYRVNGVVIPDPENIVATYPIAPLAGSSNQVGAGAFVAFVGSPTAQTILKRYKFLAPR